MISGVIQKLPKNILISRFIPIATNLITNNPYNITKNLFNFIYIDKFNGNESNGILQTFGHSKNLKKFILEINIGNDLLIEEEITLLRENNIDYKLKLNSKYEIILFTNNINIDMNNVYNDKIKKLINNIIDTNITNKYIITK